MKSHSTSSKHRQPIAIIGMGCLFPKSPGLKGYWRLLLHGDDAITDVPASHWLHQDYYHRNPKKPDHVYCTRGGFIPPIAFDPTEFGIPPSSLEATDTSQLLGLVVAKKALEDAGYGDDRSFNREKTSVVLGVTGTQELVIPLGARLGHPIWRKALINSGIAPDKTEQIIQDIADSYVSWQENSFPGLLGNVVAGRISNRLDLGGTNCVVDAACASSLSAVHLAIMELATGRADMVVTGGVDTLNDIFMHMCFAKTMVLSPTGDIRPFSKDADGTILGEGIGIFILKRLADAEKDGDRIYAVIKGIGTSSDGKSQSIYAPRAEGQAKALRMAYAEADIEPSSVALIEAHGTGTRIGDIVEFQSLNSIFSDRPDTRQKCALGSVKSMIGHTKAAAGAAGLMKAVLSLHNKVLLPTIKAQPPDPKLNIHQSPFYLNTRSRPWFSNGAHPRRSGVSAFGFGGSNFHVVVEEYGKQKPDTAWDGSVDIVALSAASLNNLRDQVAHFKAAVDDGTGFQELSRKAQRTKTQFSAADPYRLLIVMERSADLKALFRRALDAVASDKNENFKRLGNVFYGGPGDVGQLAFVFPGQGSQYVDMGRDLACTFPEAFGVLEKANQIFDTADRLTDWMYPCPARDHNDKTVQEDALRQTVIAQPAVGTVSVSMLKVLDRFGVQPDVTCGHSFGELTALFAAGWIDLNTLLRLAVSRGRLMAAASNDKSQHRGSMLAIKAPLEAIETLINDTNAGVILANRNAPEQGVVSGSVDAIENMRAVCEDRGFKTARLPVSAAFHSGLIKDAREPFRQILHDITIAPTRIPVLSNITGKPYPNDSQGAKNLLGEHLLNPVDFVSEITNAFNMGVNIFVEIGPKSVLTSLIKSILKDRPFHAIAVDESSGSRSGLADLARAICHLASIGHPVDLENWEPAARKPRKNAMSIPLSGTNFRKPKISTNTRDQAVSHRHAAASNKQHAATRVNPLPTTGREVPEPTSKPADTSRKAMDSNSKKQHPFITDALKVVQEGLSSMQALQAQTARAHQKFLESQTEASRALQRMMEQTQRLATASFGVMADTAEIAPRHEPAEDLPWHESAGETPVSPNPSRQPSPGGVGEAQNQHQANHSASAPEPVPAIRIQVPEKPPHHTDQTPENVAQKGIVHDLLATVSRLTGYPVEMLDLDMDIEADLGIDSIKRVEILSALEEKISPFPAISPEVMGSLKTLGQIIDTVEGASDDVAATEAETEDAINRQFIEDLLLQSVSRLTGYPMEMLGLDMDIEADLGIDSIKRVEILSSIEEELPNLSPLSPEIIAAMKTLGQIVAYLSSTAESTVPGPENESFSNENTDGYIEKPDASIDPPHAPETRQADTPSVACLPHAERKTVSLTKQALNRGHTLPLPRNRKVFITDDDTGLGRAIAARLNQAGVETAVLNGRRLDPEEVQKAAGLIVVAANEQHAADFLKQAFLLTNQIATGLLASGAEGGALFATITRLDGAFGFKGGGVANPMQGGLAGLAKTAAHEWRQVSCRALDISPAWKDNAAIADAVVNELLFTGDSGVNEIGLEADARWIPTLEPASYPRGNLDIHQKEVIVISGGARGVTAAVAAALAEEAKPTLVLLGRSPAPTPEPEWLVPLEDESIIKRAILENDFKGQKVSPRELQNAYRKYLANREITENLDSMARAGADVHYHTVDIRDVDQVKNVLAKVRSACGPIKGIIHGAGILEDRWIVDKTLEQFESVFDTKVKGLETLLAATRSDPLKYLILFSSVAARFGNGGQVDYAMANEVLNKMAQQESATRPDCKVISVNWGPWDGGMVCTALKRKFQNDGISLISKDAGARCLLLEMTGDKNQPVEVVIGANVVPERPKSGVCNTFEGPAQPESTADQETPVPVVARRRLAVI